MNEPPIKNPKFTPCVCCIDGIEPFSVYEWVDCFDFVELMCHDHRETFWRKHGEAYSEEEASDVA